MPSFFDIKEGGWPVYALMASFVVLLIGGISTVYFELIYEVPQIKTLKCSECEHTMDILQEEFLVMVKQRDEEFGGDTSQFGGGEGGEGMPPMPPGMPGGMMMRPWGQFGWPLVCPECNAESLYSAIRCQECDTVFYRGEAGDQRYPDTCPSCSFSRHRQMQEERRAEEAASRERRRQSQQNR